MRRTIRKLIRILLNRNTLFILMLLLQVTVLVLTVLFLSQHYLPIYLLLMALDLVLVVYISNTSEDPSMKLPWFISMLVFPLFTGLAYLMVKTDAGHRHLKQRCAEKAEKSRQYLPQSPYVMEQLRSRSTREANLAAYLRDYGAYPVYANEESVYYPDGALMFEAMKQEIARAKRYIFLEFFIISAGEMWETLHELLRQKAAEGVEVRLMYDGFGTQFLMPRRYFAGLADEGIRCRVFNSFKPLLTSSQNNRDHRKILVIDGEVAFTGGINIADEYTNSKRRFGHWKDGGMLCRGAAAWSFTVMFLQLWDLEDNEADVTALRPPETVPVRTDGFIQPYSDSPTDNENVGELVYLDIINNAEHYVYIMTPYLMLDHELVTALGLAAKKGVDVRIMTPHIPDKWYAYCTAWSYYRDLLEQHVRIFEYEPGFVHAKNMCADDRIGVVGTINMDYRSLYLHFECAAVAYGAEMVRDIRRDFTQSLERCIEIRLEDCAKRPLFQRAAGWILRIFAPLL